MAIARSINDYGDILAACRRSSHVWSSYTDLMTNLMIDPWIYCDMLQTAEP